MARMPRFLISHQPTTYHVISRTALDGFPLGEQEKSLLLKTIQNLSSIYFCQVLGFCIMGNHFHLLVTMLPEDQISDEEVQKRYATKYGDEFTLMPGQIPFYRQKWTSLSEYVKEIKQNFTRMYNKKRGRRGTFWAERFKSLIVEKGETLINCLAYIDLNPIRAGLVERPEEYRWSSLGCRFRTGRNDTFLSWNLGLEEYNVKDRKERLCLYRDFVYARGGVDLGKGKTLEAKSLPEGVERFIQRTRFFTESGIIGSREFVRQGFELFRDIIQPKRQRQPHKIQGLDQIYSLKRLS
ncbi:MAG: transposase [Desulfohalobiaceae bacterium]|nr:transposase [Desulfohalobiaceae bacterium]